MRAPGRWIVIGLLLIFHFGLHPVWSSWPAGPDLLAGGVLLGSLLLRSGQAAILGFVLGTLEASMSLGPLGPTMLVLAGAGFVGAWLRDVFYSDTGRFGPTFLFVGVFALQQTLNLVAGSGVSLQGVLLWGPISALVTTVVCWALDRLISVFVA